MSRMSMKDPEWQFSRRDLNRCGPDGKRLFLTLEQTAAHFGISLHTVLTWCKLGAVPEHRLGSRIFLNRLEVEQYWAMFAKRR